MVSCLNALLFSQPSKDDIHLITSPMSLLRWNLTVATFIFHFMLNLVRNFAAQTVIWDEFFLSTLCNNRNYSSFEKCLKKWRVLNHFDVSEAILVTSSVNRNQVSFLHYYCTFDFNGYEMPPNDFNHSWWDENNSFIAAAGSRQHRIT